MLQGRVSLVGNWLPPRHYHCSRSPVPMISPGEYAHAHILERKSERSGDVSRHAARMASARRQQFVAAPLRQRQSARRRRLYNITRDKKIFHGQIRNKVSPQRWYAFASYLVVSAQKPKYQEANTKCARESRQTKYGCQKSGTVCGV